MARRDSLLTRSLEPLLSSLWLLFIVWTALVTLLWTSGIGEDEVKASVANAGLRDALLVLLRSADSLWIILASANLYLSLAAREGLGTARIWAAVILSAGAAIAVASVLTEWPLGPVLYTKHLGLKLGPVPLGLPLWWLVVVIGGRMLAERLWPRASHGQLAAATGALALLTACNLEPLAWKVRFFWFWYLPGTHLAGEPPWRNYLTWWLVATILAFLLRTPRVATSVRPPSWRPAATLLLFNGAFLATHLAVAFRR
jgi:uncharacterized membrane protein